MKVLLVVPNFRWVNSDPNTLWHFLPYNLCLLAAMVRDIAEVEILDAHKLNLSQEGFKADIRQKSPDLVGITVLMDEYGQAGHVAARLVKEVGDITTVFGGVYATTNPEQVMEDINVDYAVLGEGEHVFRALIEGLNGGIIYQGPGLCYREGRKVINTGHSDFIKELDKLPAPAYDLIDFSSYATSAERKSVDSPRAYPYARVMTSRGCPFNCIFCQVKLIMGQRFRGRSAEKVLDEIQMLKDNYGIKSLIFDDDNLLFNRNRAVALFQGMVKKGLAMPWVMIATAVFELDPELIKLMRASGCEYIDVAIETGTNRVMKDVIDKPVNFEYAKQMIKLARESGIYVAANFIIGFPTETWDEIRQSLKKAEEIDASYVKIFSAIPLRNTRLWDMCVEGGYFKKGFDVSKVKWSTGQIETKDFSPDHLTILRAYEWDRINFSDRSKFECTCRMMDMTADEMNTTRKQTLANALQLIRNGAINGLSDEVRTPELGRSTARA